MYVSMYILIAHIHAHKHTDTSAHVYIYIYIYIYIYWWDRERERGGAELWIWKIAKWELYNYTYRYSICTRNELCEPIKKGHWVLLPAIFEPEAFFIIFLFQSRVTSAEMQRVCKCWIRFRFPHIPSYRNWNSYTWLKNRSTFMLCSRLVPVFFCLVRPVKKNKSYGWSRVELFQPVFFFFFFLLPLH